MTVFRYLHFDPEKDNHNYRYLFYRFFGDIVHYDTFIHMRPPVSVSEQHFKNYRTVPGGKKAMKQNRLEPEY
jgi:hypothetical protein